MTSAAVATSDGRAISISETLVAAERLPLRSTP
jgi:hypothetical protein